MAKTQVVYYDMATDKFSGTDPEYNAEPFIQVIRRKINFSLGDGPADAG